MERRPRHARDGRINDNESAGALLLAAIDSAGLEQLSPLGSGAEQPLSQGGGASGTFIPVENRCWPTAREARDPCGERLLAHRPPVET